MECFVAAFIPDQSVTCYRQHFEAWSTLKSFLAEPSHFGGKKASLLSQLPSLGVYRSGCGVASHYSDQTHPKPDA